MKRKIINDPVYGFLTIPSPFIFDVTFALTSGLLFEHFREQNRFLSTL